MKTVSIQSIILVAFIFLHACNKTEGPGGTSTIQGIVTGQEFDAADAEVTEVIVSPGADIEHGDYWIINAPVGGTFYYIWYDNPTWVSDGDPYLSGRTGIAVTFNYSDSNTEIASNTASAISAIAGNDFSLLVQNDIITLTNKTSGYVPDANNMTAPFEINVANQGDNQILTATAPLADARVYLVYGDATGYGDEVRTGGDGDYSFSNLVKGNYTVYVVSKDTLNPENFVKQESLVSVTENRSVTTNVNLHLIY